MDPSIQIITLDKDNLTTEHICCGFTDRKNQTGYQLKKELIRSRFEDGFVFKKFDIRGKVFIEYSPAEKAWCPVDAPGYTFIHCFWVSGRHKKQGYGTRLLEECINESKGKNGLIAVSSHKTRPFLTDKSFFTKHGFQVSDTSPPYFELLVRKLRPAADPKFKEIAKTAVCENKNGVTLYYSDLCAFSDYWVDQMAGYIRKLNLPVKKIKIKTIDQARNHFIPFVPFSVFYNGKFLTHEIMTEKKFIKTLEKFKE